MPRAIILQGDRRTELVFAGTPALGALLARHGLGVQQPCGGRGVCGKCAVQASGGVSAPNAAERRAGGRLACQVRLLGDCVIRLPAEPVAVCIQTEGVAQSGGAPAPMMPGDYGAAVDIGTTTVVLKLYDLKTGVCLSTQAALNPQARLAADVIGRISAAMNGSGALLRDAVTDCVGALLSRACAEAGVPGTRVGPLVVTGNTTMLYLLTGRDPEPLAHAPFHADTLFGDTETVLGRSAFLPPCMDAFVGADITCAALSSGLCEQTGTALLMDVGTNGEVALWHEGSLRVASTAAGPAFEGAGISCGCGSVTGAVDKAWVENGRIAVHTVGNAPAVGVCGSGLIDAVAAMLELGFIDETGALDGDRVPLAEDLFLTARDVRSVQLAKGAVAAGVRTMLRAAEIGPDDVATLYVAGGFGSRLNVRSAALIGLIPREWTDRVRVIGNAALSGAEMLLLGRATPAQARRLAGQAHTVALGGNPVFSELFLECLGFAQ